MIEIIKQIDGWQGKTAQEIADVLNATIKERKPNSPQLQEGAWATNARGLRDFGPGPNGWGSMLNKLTELQYDDVRQSLIGGIDFGEPATQSMIDQLGQVAADVFTPERCAILKSWGVSETSIAQRDLGAAVTVEQVQDELNRYAGEQLLASINAKANAVMEAARVEYIAGRMDSILSAAEAAWSGN